MFSLRLKELRESRFKSQRAFAQEFGVAQSTVGMWESGSRVPDLDTAQRLADFFHVSVDYLLGREEQKKTPAGIDADGRERTVTVIGRDGKAEKRVYSKEKYEAIQQLLDNMDYTVMDDDL